MLKILRNRKTAKKIWIGLGIIILPAFILWGFGGAMRDREEKDYGIEIGGKRIPYSQFQESYQAVKNAAIISYGNNFRQALKEADLEAQAWQRIAMVYEAKKLKIKVSDREVIEKIESYPFFWGKKGFDNRLYTELLQHVFKTQPRAFEEQVRQNIMISKLFKDLTSGITVSDEEIRQGYIKNRSKAEPKFKFSEEKFLSEREEFKEILLAEKKDNYFLGHISRLIK